MDSTLVWNILKWFGVSCFAISTIIMLNPHVAATSITPWALFLIGNVIWIIAAYKKDWALFGMCLFYILWDTLLVLSRYNPHLFDAVQPIIDLMANL